MERKGIVAASEKTADGWISVKDRLPEYSGPVLVATCNGFVCVDCYLYRPFNDSPIGWESFVDSDITHWMPLPEPPKDGE